MGGLWPGLVDGQCIWYCKVIVSLPANAVSRLWTYAVTELLCHSERGGKDQKGRPAMHDERRILGPFATPGSHMGEGGRCSWVQDTLAVFAVELGVWLMCLGLPTRSSDLSFTCLGNIWRFYFLKIRYL